MSWMCISNILLGLSASMNHASLKSAPLASHLFRFGVSHTKQKTRSALRETPPPSLFCMSSACGGEGRNHLLRGEGGFWLGCARGLDDRETVSSNHKFPLTSMSIGDFFGHEYAHTHTGGPTEYGDMAALAYDRAQRGRW
jgi:hypothetical protein